MNFVERMLQQARQGLAGPHLTCRLLLSLSPQKRVSVSLGQVLKHSASSGEGANTVKSGGDTDLESQT